MVHMRLISREEALQSRQRKEPGVRLRRMREFDAYVRALIDNPREAVVYEGIEEQPQQFILSLRGAFRRAGAPAVVRKLRGRDEIRAWLEEPTPEPEPVIAAKPAGRGRGRPKAS